MQWRRWCLKKDYAIGYEGDWLRQNFANTKMPMTSIAFTDDEMMSMKNVEMLHEFFTGAEKDMITVKPSDIGQKRIGHIGWHKERYRKLWDNYFLPALDM
jgi:predicted alpha/beta hydrolase